MLTVDTIYRCQHTPLQRAFISLYDSGVERRVYTRVPVSDLSTARRTTGHYADKHDETVHCSFFIQFHREE